jgi:hypothetical protein
MIMTNNINIRFEKNARWFLTLMTLFMFTVFQSGCVSTHKSNIVRIPNIEKSMGCDAFNEIIQPLPKNSISGNQTKNIRQEKWKGGLLNSGQKIRKHIGIQIQNSINEQQIQKEKRPKSIIPYITFFLIIGVLLLLIGVGITISTEAWAIIGLGTIILLVLLFVFT